MKQLLLLIFLIPILISAQTESIESSDVVNVSLKDGPEDSDLQTLFDFENINYSEFSFQFFRQKALLVLKTTWIHPLLYLT